MDADTLLFSFPIASGDLRFIEVNSREIHLIQLENSSIIIRGEISGCGSGCHIDLSEIFLEFAVSCKGCQDHKEAEDMVNNLGFHLADQVFQHLEQAAANKTIEQQILFTFECLMNSISTKHKTQQDGTDIIILFDQCPFTVAARTSGLDRGLALAYTGFISLCIQSLNLITPNWKLFYPPDFEQNGGLLKIILKKEVNK